MYRENYTKPQSGNHCVGLYSKHAPGIKVWGVIATADLRGASLYSVIVDTSISAFSYKKIYLILVRHAKKFCSLGQCATSVSHAVSCSVIMKQFSEGISYSACMTSAKFFVVLGDVIHCTERHISSTSRGKNTVRRGVVLKYLSIPKRKFFFNFVLPCIIV